jgi:hypothetical protein
MAEGALLVLLMTAAGQAHLKPGHRSCLGVPAVAKGL